MKMIISTNTPTSRLRNYATLAIASLFLTANVALAQLTPGPDPITGTVNTAQTLASGTGTVSATGQFVHQWRQQS